MPSPFQNLAACTHQDYVTVVWRKVQKGTATSKWTCLPFRPYGFSGVVMLYPRCFIIWWCWWELVNTWQILLYKVILIWYRLFNIFWSLPYPLDCRFCVYLPALRVLLQLNNGPLLVSIKNAEGNSERLKEGQHTGVFTLLCIHSPHKADLAELLCDFLVILNIQQLTQVAILLLSGLNTILWPQHYELTWHPDLLDCTTSRMNSTNKDSFLPYLNCYRCYINKAGQNIFLYQLYQKQHNQILPIAGRGGNSQVLCAIFQFP